MVRSTLRTVHLLSERISTPAAVLAERPIRRNRAPGNLAGAETPPLGRKASAGDSSPATAQPILRRTRGGVKEPGPGGADFLVRLAGDDQVLGRDQGDLVAFDRAASMTAAWMRGVAGRCARVRRRVTCAVTAGPNRFGVLRHRRNPWPSRIALPAPWPARAAGLGREREEARRCGGARTVRRC